MLLDGSNITFGLRRAPQRRRKWWPWGLVVVVATVGMVLLIAWGG